MLKRATTRRGREKQLEKEIRWSMIPEEQKPSFKAAEAVQWEEHLRLGALRPLDIEESAAVIAKHSDRIIPSRFAYRDKNLAKRRTMPTTPWKPQSRLVVGGHPDPDVKTGSLRTDSPTVRRIGVMCLLQIAAMKAGPLRQEM